MHVGLHTVQLLWSSLPVHLHVWYLALLVNKRLSSCSLEKLLFLLAHKLSVFCGHMLDCFLASGGSSLGVYVGISNASALLCICISPAVL